MLRHATLARPVPARTQGSYAQDVPTFATVRFNQHNRPPDGDTRQLRIYTLGHFRVLLPDSAGGGEPTWSNSHCRTLLKYLVAAPDHRRSCEQIIELLWPEVDPDRGREYLRDTVSRLRRALEPDRQPYGCSPYLTKDRESVALLIQSAPGSLGLSGSEDEVDIPAGHGAEADVCGAWLDKDAFEGLGHAALAALERRQDMRAQGYAALALYRGPFLPLEMYSDWAKSPRQRCHRLWSTLIRRVAYTELAERQFDAAIHLLGQLLDAVPDDEDAAQLSMVVHAANGRRGDALRIYQAFAEAVRTEHGGEPSAELHVLRDAIRDGQSMGDRLSQLM
jgi:DNA-binding SARP family transcriptional activator